MSKGDRSSVRVDLFVRDLERVDAHNRLRRERLVDLKQVDVGDRKSRLGENLGDGERGSDSLRRELERAVGEGEETHQDRKSVV